ncbi:MAG: 3-phosphoserine/phosphohydroxythreonine transaminase [Acidimicrobiia bacterium]|nr:3-phosphoserine/phosphohydroxythreonine transaminase [Acidimicrobiia bacterium]
MRKFNFSAGPCTLPLEVLEEAQVEFVDYHGAGMSLVEMSHRSSTYDAVHMEAMAKAKSVFGAPDDFSVVFLGGGATLQFAMIPMNLLAEGQRGAHVVTGEWASKALSDGSHHGDLYAAWDGGSEGYRRMPAPEEIVIEPNTRYLHVTSNETIGGIRFNEFPDVGVPLVGDMSSDYMTRAIPWDLFDLVYGGAQKNLGPAGVDITFIRNSVLEETNRDLGAYLRYDIHASKNSMYNTPPVYAVYMVGKVLRWMESQGGLAVMESQASRKSGLVYDAIDASDGFYRSQVDRRSRSHMNVVFHLPSEELDAGFLAEATRRNMSGLKGYRTVGGVRASLYNALPVEAVDALVELMADFRSANA